MNAPKTDLQNMWKAKTDKTTEGNRQIHDFS